MSKQELRCKIFWSATEGVGTILVLHVKLAQSKVAKGDMTSVIQQDVFGFQIPVDDLESV